MGGAVRVALAPSPEDKSVDIRLLCSAETLRNAFQKGYTARLAQFKELVVGDPEDPHQIGLKSAYALFRGLRRPLGANPGGEAIYAYVSHPPCDFVGDWPDPHGPLRAVVQARPKDSVFVVYADIPDQQTDPHLAQWRREAEDQEVRGLVLHWEWVTADFPQVQGFSQAYLPIYAATRYAQRIW